MVDSNKIGWRGGELQSVGPREIETFHAKDAEKKQRSKNSRFARRKSVWGLQNSLLRVVKYGFGASNVKSGMISLMPMFGQTLKRKDISYFEIAFVC